MQFVSASTRTVDPYRAGSEIAERLGAITPEVAILFATVHYLDRMGEVLAGVRDMLGDGVLVCGGTSDGIYETSQVAHHGVCAFGIASEGRLRWSAALARGVGAESVLAAENAARQAQEGLGMSASLGFVLADGVRADGSRVVEGVRRSLAAPFFGGLAADDRRFVRSAVFLGEEAVQDAVMVLTAGGDIPFRIHTASGWKPMGDAGQVTDAEGTRLKMIDGRPANEFIREQIGKNCSESDLGLMPLAEYRSPGDGEFVLRTPSAADPVSGELTLFGRIEEGSVVRVCHASLEDILGGVEDALAGMRDSEFEPGGVLVVSCAGRKWLLPESGREEVERVIRKLGNLPMAGIPSFGEIGPFRLDRGGYSPVLFHNVTFVVCALGG